MMKTCFAVSITIVSALFTLGLAWSQTNSSRIINDDVGDADQFGPVVSASRLGRTVIA
jgi:hypothetical protein